MNMRDNITNYYKNKFKIQKIAQYKMDRSYKNKYKNESIKECHIKKRINLRKSSLFGKIYDNITTRINEVLKENNLIFRMDYDKIIGLMMDELENYITGKLKPGMTLDNYGDWEIDHIYPISKFDFSIPSSIDKCFNYTNLQPLWMLENREKYNKII
jgi:hypothetical protein